MMTNNAFSMSVRKIDESVAQSYGVLTNLFCKMPCCTRKLYYLLLCNAFVKYFKNTAQGIHAAYRILANNFIESFLYIIFELLYVVDTHVNIVDAYPIMI